MNIKGFTLIELLIVIAIIGTLAGIVIVSLSGSTDNADDAAVKANLRSVATLYAEVFADEAGTGSLCTSDKVQGAMETIFVGNALEPPHTTATDSQDQYLDSNNGTSTALTALSTTTKNGCVSSSSGDWVVWGDLSSDDGMAWCIDSSGKNGEVDTGGSGDTFALDLQGTALNALENIDCSSIGS